MRFSIHQCVIVPASRDPLGDRAPHAPLVMRELFEFEMGRHFLAAHAEQFFCADVVQIAGEPIDRSAVRRSRHGVLNKKAPRRALLAGG
jgi:hypothetical protein